MVRFGLGKLVLRPPLEFLLQTFCFCDALRSVDVSICRLRERYGLPWFAKKPSDCTESKLWQLVGKSLTTSHRCKNPSLMVCEIF